MWPGYQVVRKDATKAVYLRCGAKRTRNSLSAIVSARCIPCARECGRTLVFDCVHPVDDAIRLRYSLCIEVLAHGERQLALLDSTLRLGASHCGRELSDALAEDDVAAGVSERGRGVKAVGATVALEKGVILGVPAHLQEGPKSVRVRMESRIDKRGLLTPDMCSF